MSNPNNDLTLLLLWDTLEGHYIALDREKNYENEDGKFWIGRVRLFAAHPQLRFYQPVGSALAQRQDVITLIATQMMATGFECQDQHHANKV